MSIILTWAVMIYHLTIGYLSLYTAHDMLHNNAILFNNYYRDLQSLLNKRMDRGKIHHFHSNVHYFLYEIWNISGMKEMFMLIYWQNEAYYYWLKNLWKCVKWQFFLQTWRAQRFKRMVLYENCIDIRVCSGTDTIFGDVSWYIE